jgi:flagellin-like hook-associated protein FlgL
MHMAFEISANPVAMQAYNNLAVNQAQASQALAKVSRQDGGASRISFDETQSVSQLQSTLATSQRAITSTQNAINALEVARAAYSEALSLANEGLTLANARLAGEGDSAAIDTRLTAIAARISDIGSSATSGGNPVLGQSLSVTVNGGGDTITLTPSSIASIDTSESVVAGYTNAVSSISAAAETNSANLAALYGTLQTLESTVATQQSAVGQILDAGLAAEMMAVTSENIMSDAVSAMVAQSTLMSDKVRSLLQ